MIVMDASAVVEALIGTDHKSRAIRSLSADRAVLAPELVDVEITHAIRGLVRADLLSASTAERALRQFARLPIERTPHLPFLPRVWELRANLTSYDAMYVAVAEAFNATLITTDRRLSNAPGLRCPITVVG